MTLKQSDHSYKTSGFTLVELLVVIAIIAILAGMALPTMGRMKQKASEVACLNQRRQFALALDMYALDEGRYVPNSYYGSGNGDPDWFRQAANGKTYLELELQTKWVPGWLEYGKVKPDNTNKIFLQHSLLARYLGTDLKLWKCPDERATVSDGKREQPWLRTVSLNGFISGIQSYYDDGPYRMFKRPDDMPDPAQLFTFAEERAEGINSCVFYFGSGMSQHSRSPGDEELGNYPGYFHRRGATLAFGDGHVETHHWMDERTTPRSTGKPLDFHSASPNNADVKWLYAHGSAPR